MNLNTIIKKLPGRKIFLQLQFLKRYWDVANGVNDTAAVFKLNDSVKAFMQDSDQAEIKKYLEAHPVWGAMLKDRYLAPKYAIADLAQYAPGTLGNAYYKHMTDNGFDLEFYPPIKVVDDLSYLNLRVTQTHDIWHAVTGYGTDAVGEIGLQAFYLGQSGTDDDGFAMLLISAACMYAVLKEQHITGTLIEAISEGYKLGKAAKSIHSAHWEEMWDKPLADIRAEYNLTVPKITRYQSAEPPTEKAAEKELVLV
jgi:ubiquinone biosynthesis protein COQ4